MKIFIKAKLKGVRILGKNVSSFLKKKKKKEKEIGGGGWGEKQRKSDVKILVSFKT